MNELTRLEAKALAYIEAILQVGWDADYHDFAFWRPDGPDDAWRAFAICNDTFAWATADCEEIEPEDVPLLRKCLEDLLAIEREHADKRMEDMSRSSRNDLVATAYLPALFAARKRGLRPMAACYEDENAMGPAVAALFDAAGPERTDSEGRRRRVYDQEVEA